MSQDQGILNFVNLQQIDIIEKAQFIIPEYKIELLNKSKKIIDKIEHINKIENFNSKIEKYSKPQKDEKKYVKNLIKKTKIKEEIKKDKKPRTLWMRKKKAS